MNRNLFLITLAGALGVATQMGALAQAPKIQFQTNTFDFGRVSQGEVVRAEFIFTNIGNATLEIINVAPGCGCTTAGTWDKLVAPGKTGVIPLQFNTTGFLGRVHKAPSVSCNDTSQPAINLNIVGEIWRPVEVNPAFVLFNVTSSMASNQVQSVRITNNLSTPLVLSEVTSSHPSFKPILREIQPGKEFELQVHLVPPIQPGNVQGVITAKTTSAQSPLVTVNAMVVLQPPVNVFPTALTLQAGPLVAPASASLRLLNNSPVPLQLTNPAVTLSNVTVNVREDNPGRLFTVTLTFPAGLDLPAGQPAEFSIQTANREMPLIKVPITQMARASIPAPPPAIQTSAPPQDGHAHGQPRRPAPRTGTELPPLPPEVALPGAPSPEK